ncbi:hypothetical protein SCOR_29650 [Sulfidibacter corallicola]|uniref:F5/8 type C domain-containing protein n=1 Tax=Sulfidibacter corallicola TaxID=2818388 RepID=A0A8A4TLC2_SULCO|nr:hypothetical protein [Sulfidibacter corallicola]QTD50277.1 hypothetical protein J3U87_32230 [Sulfidibacter corallicola]
MKRYPLFFFAIAVAFTANSAMAETLNWYFTSDNTLDGVVTNEYEVSVTGQINKKHFYFHPENETAPTSFFSMGNIETDAEDVGGASRITFETYAADGTYRGAGEYIGGGQYQGTWYDSWGGKGDFLLDTAPGVEIPPENGVKVDTVQESVWASSAYNANPARAIIDGVIGANNSPNTWISHTTDATPTIGFDTQTTAVVTHYRMSRAYCNGEAYIPGTWNMYGKNDNTSWTLIDTVDIDQGDAFPINSCGSFGEYYVVDNPGSYKSYKFAFIASSQSNNVGVGVGEIELYQ